MGELHNGQESEDFFEIGNRELDAGNIDEAITAFKRAIEVTPDDPRPYSNLGIAYELAKNFGMARDAYEKAIDINPKNTATINNLAGLSLLEGNPHEALSLYDFSIFCDPMYMEPYLSLARFFMEAEEFEIAERYCLQVIAIEPDNVEGLNFLGIIKNLTERSEEAVGHFQAALRSDFNQASVLSNLGTALWSTGDLNKAIIAFEKANELNPNNISILNNLGLLYREADQTEKSEKLFKLALLLFPENPFTYFNIAELYIARNDYENALEYLKQYVGRAPLDMDNLFKTCGIARMADRLEDVVGEMISFVEESDPNDPRVETVREWLATTSNP
jgi:tetratricopeptide (TPR) repeat protein